MVWILLASSMFSAGGAAMKFSDGFTRVGPSILILACFVVGAALLTKAVAAGGLSTTYAFGLGLEAVISVGVGVALGERLTMTQCSGLACIMVGLAITHLG